MRRIDLNKIQADQEWENFAAQEQQAINNGVKQPKQVSYIWSGAKFRLKNISSGKCWYCETKENRSDDAVDHFRPKTLYPWLTCNITNFRYACTFCNSLRKDPETGETKGKGDQFPLLGGARAQNSQQLAAEQYALIDPCNAADVGLIDFRDDGRPCAKYPDMKNRNSRAILSIKAYHLDHPELNEARRQIALQIADWVKVANLAYEQLDQAEQEKHEMFSSIAGSIGRAITSDAPFSVFAKKVVKGYRNYPWVEDILDCV
ncbi:MAG: hypothetical protein WEB02_11575 [Methylophaga sp.]